MFFIGTFMMFREKLFSSSHSIANALPPDREAIQILWGHLRVQDIFSPMMAPLGILSIHLLVDVRKLNDLVYTFVDIGINYVSRHVAVLVKMWSTFVEGGEDFS
jgi:hypothetical protein